MRAIHLSLMQRSTQTNQRSRQSSSSSSSTSSYRDQAHGVQAPQDMSYLSAVDGASLQKAIELSLRDSAVGGGNIRLFLLVKLKIQGCHFLSKKWTGYHVKVLLESKGQGSMNLHTLYRKINSTIWKYCSLAFIWTVTCQGFIHRLEI